jgi:hypothetical protein
VARLLLVGSRLLLYISAVPTPTLPASATLGLCARRLVDGAVLVRPCPVKPVVFATHLATRTVPGPAD